MQQKYDDDIVSASEKTEHLSMRPSALQQAVVLSSHTWCY